MRGQRIEVGPVDGQSRPPPALNGAQTRHNRPLKELTVMVALLCKVLGGRARPMTHLPAPGRLSTPVPKTRWQISFVDISKAQVVADEERRPDSETTFRPGLINETAPAPADPFRTMNGGSARTPNTDRPHLSSLEARPTTLHSMEAARAGAG